MEGGFWGGVMLWGTILSSAANTYFLGYMTALLLGVAVFVGAIFLIFWLINKGLDRRKQKKNEVNKPIEPRYRWHKEQK